MPRPSLFTALVAALLLPACDADYWGLGFQDFYGAPLDWEPPADAVDLPVVVVASTPDRDPAASLAGMLATLDTIAAEAPATRLVLFGELSLGWYHDPDDPEGYQRSVAQPVPGPATDAVGDWAAAHGTYVGFGLAEARGETLHNSAALVGPDGELVAVHAKVNLNGWDVEGGFEPGPGVTVADVDGHRVGFLICSDFEGTDVMRDLAAEAPEAVLMPLSSAMSAAVDPTARQLGAWVLAANRYGDEGGVAYDGTVWVSNPVGTHEARSSGRATWLPAVLQVAP